MRLPPNIPADRDGCHSLHAMTPPVLPSAGKVVEGSSRFPLAVGRPSVTYVRLAFGSVLLVTSLRVSSLYSID